MSDLCVYANRFTPVVKRGEFSALNDVAAYERAMEKRWEHLQQELAASSYRRTMRMPIKGRDYGLMGVHVERGEMSPDDPFTDFYGLIRYWDGQRVETFAHRDKSSGHSKHPAGVPHYFHEEEILLVTDDLHLAVKTHEIMLKDLPASVVADNLERIRLRGFVEYMISGHRIPVLETIVDLNPMVSGRNGSLITRVYGEGSVSTGSDFPGEFGKN